MPQDSVKQIVSDPQFWTFSRDTQLSLLKSADSSVGKMGKFDQIRLLTTLRPAPTPTPTTGAEQQQNKLAQQGFLSSMGESALGMDAGPQNISFGDVVHQAGQNLRETGGLLASHPVDTAKLGGEVLNAPLQQLGENDEKMPWYLRLLGPAGDIVPVVQTIKQALHPQGEKIAGQIANENYTGAAGTLVGTVAPFLATKGGNAAASVGERAVQEGARGVEIAGERIPIAAADLETQGVRRGIQSTLEKSAAGGPIQETRAAQATAGKQAISRVIQRESGAPGVAAESPAVTAEQTAKTIRAQAEPLYDEVRQSTEENPVNVDRLRTAAQQQLASMKDASLFGPDAVGAPVKRALERAATSGGESDAGKLANMVAKGQGYSSYGEMQASNPALAKRILPLDIQDALSGAGETGTFQSVQDARSAVRDALRKTVDRNDRRVLSGIEQNMTSALQDAAPEEAWTKLKKADQLWSKSYAIDEIGDALHSSLTGTPESIQRGINGASVKPQQLSAESFIKKLNDLEREGTLDRAFTPEHATTIRQISEVLSRGQASGGMGRPGGFMNIMLLHAGGAMAGTALGHPIAGLVTPATFLAASHIAARALATPAGAKSLLMLLRAPAGSAEAATFAARAASAAQSQQKDNQ